jgi:excisionase family DNA binding protein
MSATANAKAREALYISIEEIAGVLGKSRWTVRRFVLGSPEEGRCPFIRVGDSILVEKADFETWRRSIRERAIETLAADRGLVTPEPHRRGRPRKASFAA